jgi:hypothetical protein
MSEVKFNSASGATQMPPKMSQDRGHTAGVSYDPMSISRRQSAATRSKSGIVDQHGRPVTKTMPGMNLEPSPVDPPAFPDEENGMKPDQVITDDPNDAQLQHTDAPPIEQTTEKPAPIETSAAPPSEGTSDPTPGDSDPGPTGGAREPGYPALLDEAVNHPVGYSGT